MRQLYYFSLEFLGKNLEGRGKKGLFGTGKPFRLIEFWERKRDAQLRGEGVMGLRGGRGRKMERGGKWKECSEK
jgi:hypothetical protein